MYKCPNASCRNEKHFTRKDICVVELLLDERGNTRENGPYALKDAGPVLCSWCAARAEWRDTRQLEMFAAEPEMFPT